MIKLLYVINSLEGSGGSERALINRSNFLIKHYNYQITIVTTKIGDTCSTFYKIDNRIEIINIPIDFTINTLYKKLNFLFYRNLAVEKPLIDFINKYQFDICTSFGAETFLYKKIRHEKFIKIKEQRFTYKKLLNDDKVPFYKKVWRKVRYNHALHVLKKMDYIIALTDEDASFWKKEINNIKVMPNSINFSEISYSDLKNRVLISVGRLENEKDFTSLIKAFNIVNSKYDDWILNIFGEGSLKLELEQLIQENNLCQKIFLRGSTNYIYSEYENSSIFVITSMYEGFPNAMLEANAHGLPIVGFESVGGVKVLLEDGNNGFLIKNRSVEDLAKGIMTLIENKNIRKEMGKNSRVIAERYSENSIMEKWHQFYSSI